MTVYLIAQIQIEDQEEYQKYLDGFFEIFDQFNGSFIASNPQTEVLEGEWAYPRTAVMQFPSEEDARNWYQSPQYQSLSQHRHKGAKSNLVLVHGV